MHTESEEKLRSHAASKLHFTRNCVPQDAPTKSENKENLWKFYEFLMVEWNDDKKATKWCGWGGKICIKNAKGGAHALGFMFQLIDGNYWHNLGE